MINFLIVVIFLAAGAFIFLCVKIDEINKSINLNTQLKGNGLSVPMNLKSSFVWQETKTPGVFTLTAQIHAVEDTAEPSKLGRKMDLTA
jgi:hypothetical protein